jgi:hypothetical protein
MLNYLTHATNLEDMMSDTTTITVPQEPKSAAEAIQAVLQREEDLFGAGDVTPERRVHAGLNVADLRGRLYRNALAAGKHDPDDLKAAFAAIDRVDALIRAERTVGSISEELWEESLLRSWQIFTDVVFADWVHAVQKQLHRRGGRKRRLS